MKALLSPFIAMLFNKSLSTGCFPSEFKKAVVRPLLQKDGLDARQTKNYTDLCLICNLILSKLLDRLYRNDFRSFWTAIT